MCNYGVWENDAEKRIIAAVHHDQAVLYAHSNYCHIAKDTEEYGVILLAAIVHFNKNNLGCV